MMADYKQAFEKMIDAEGGYKLTNKADDHGGQTYAGISRKYNPDWQGWAAVDAGRTPNPLHVYEWYYAAFWNPILGDQIEDQDVAYSIFNFAVNTSASQHPATAIKVVQHVLGVTEDGALGEVTLGALNRENKDLFLAQFALAKVRYHADICHRDPSQLKWLVGWINRDLAV